MESAIKATQMARERGRKERDSWALKEISISLFEQSLVKWSSVLKNMCKKCDLVMRDLFSIVTFEALQILHLKVSNLLKNCLSLYLSSRNVCSHPVGISGKQIRLSSLKTPFPRACSGFLVHSKEKCALQGVYVGFARRGNTAQLNGFFL